MTAKVHILMGTYNGAPWLADQLESLRAQTHEDWQLTCSDDGSTDDTRAMLQQAAGTFAQRIEVVSGPAAGFARNFLSMVRALPDDGGHVAFADQDDIWFPDKLARACTALDALPRDRPALYGAASLIWDPVTDRRLPSLEIRRAPAFGNALIENFATGNTMMLNPPAVKLLRGAAARIGEVFAHDWLAYALVSGAGGQVVYDARPALLYRQHRANAIGAGESFVKRQLRNLSVADGRYRRKVGQQIAALEANRDMLTEANARMLDDFRSARDSRPLLLRPLRIARSGVFRQSRRDAAGFYAASALGRV